MRFISKYTWSNIKANRLRAILLISCIAFASLLFFVSLVFPMYLRNYKEETLRSYFGNSDIHMQANNSTIASMDSIPQAIKDDFEYAYGFLCLPSSRTSTVTGKDEPITYIAGNIDDVQTFNPVRVIEGSINNFNGKKMIITNSSAKKFGWSVGDNVLVLAYGLRSTFTVSAIVANEGLLSEQNEATGPIVLLSKDGLSSSIKTLIERFGKSGSITEEQIDSMFNMAVFKVKEETKIAGITNELTFLFPDYKVEETVNNKVLNQAVSYLNTPFTTCIYLVCLFCALIIYLTCKLTFAERVRQFAVLKSMGSSTGQLFASLLFESAFYGFVGGTISIVLSLLQVYMLPIVAPQMTYITPAPWYFYFMSVGFGVLIAVASSFVQAIKNARKSIKQTMLHKEKFTKQSAWVSAISVGLVVVFGALMIVTRNVSVKVVSIPFFLLTLIGVIVALPPIVTGTFWLVKQIYRKRTFEALYMKKTLPSKNLSVANRLLFFGVFLVFLFSTLISSLDVLSKLGQEYDFDIYISQANATDLTEENLADIENVEGVEHSWKGVRLEKSYILQRNEYLTVMYGFEGEEIDRIYSGDVKNYKTPQAGEILLNKYYRDTRGFKIGDTITINVGANTVDTIEFVVSGFIENYQQWGNMAVVNLNSFDAIPQIDGYNTIFVKVAKANNAQDVISRIRVLPFINQSDSEESGENSLLLTFTNVNKQQEIFLNQIKVPFLILRTYSALVLMLSILCVFIGYVLYLRESTEYHKTLFALGLNPSRFEGLVVLQSLFMTFVSVACGIGLCLLLYLNFENIFNALGTSFITKINVFVFSMYGVGIFVGTTIMAWVLGSRFKRDLLKSDKRLFG